MKKFEMKKRIQTTVSGKYFWKGFLAMTIALSLFLTLGRKTVRGEESPGFEYSLLRNKSFIYMSGMGGWATKIFFGRDGEFWGFFKDTDKGTMGSTGWGYPNGSRSVSNFIGHFSKPEKVDAYTYRMDVVDVQVLEEAGTVRVVDGVLEHYTSAIGIQDGTYYLYLPGTPRENLPERYSAWIRSSSMEAEWDTLPFYGLFNPDHEIAFGSFDQKLDPPIEEMLDQVWVDTWDLEAGDYKARMAWEDLLNSLEGIFQGKLSEEEMEMLTQEEIRWLEAKMAALQRAYSEQLDAEYAKNNIAWTRQRVYALLFNGSPTLWY